MAAKEIWIVGDGQHAHFVAPLAWLIEHAICSSFATATSAVTAFHESGKASDPAAVLLVQSRPGQISSRHVERLYAHMPLTRFVGLAGPWCEGEGRTGRPWPGVVRVPWRDWRWRLPRELDLSAAEQSTGVRLPRIATEADRLQQSMANLTGLRFVGNVELITTSRVTYGAWQPALQLLGVRAFCPSHRIAAESQADLQIIDGWDNVAMAAESADSASASTAPPRILLLHFPRPDDVTRAASLGIAAVLAQPMLLTDLAAALDGLVGRASSSACQPAA